MTITVCDECGIQCKKWVFLATGHVYIDGKEVGQHADLCDEHMPINKPGELSQPNNCIHVKFGWPQLQP